MCVRQPVNVGVAIPHDLKKRLDDAARRQMTSRATIIRKALAAHLKFEPEPEPEPLATAAVA